MECDRLKAVSRFLKWILRRSPARARISGPGIRFELPSPDGTLASGWRQLRV